MLGAQLDATLKECPEGVSVWEQLLACCVFSLEDLFNDFHCFFFSAFQLVCIASLL